MIAVGFEVLEAGAEAEADREVVPAAIEEEENDEDEEATRDVADDVAEATELEEDAGASIVELLCAATRLTKPSRQPAIERMVAKEMQRPGSQAVNRSYALG